MQCQENSWNTVELSIAQNIIYSSTSISTDILNSTEPSHKITHMHNVRTPRKTKFAHRDLLPTNSILCDFE